MKKIILALALVALAMSGCMEKKSDELLNTTQVQQVLVDSSTNLDSYKMNLETDQKITVLNLTDANNTQSQNVTIQSQGEAIIDIKGRQMMMNSLQTAMPEDDPANKSSMQSEMYFINQTMYVKLGDNWTRLEIAAGQDLWDQRNMAKNQLALINASTVENVGYETIDGENCYLIEVTPHMETYAAILSEQIGTTFPLMFMNLTELFNSSQMSWKAWITVDGHYLKKVDVQMSLTMDNRIMNLPEEVMGKIKMYIDIRSVSTYSDFNKPVNIEVPPGAVEAKELVMPQMMPVTVQPNETASEAAA